METRIEGMTPLLQVFDMAASLDFYCGALGFEVFETDDESKAPNYDWVWLRLGRSELMLNTAYESGERPETPDPARVAAHADTALFFGAPDVDAVYRHLRGEGIDVKEPVIAPYGMKQLFVKDPDGYDLCFQWKA